jgi:hypothetical protein
MRVAITLIFLAALVFPVHSYAQWSAVKDSTLDAGLFMHQANTMPLPEAEYIPAKMESLTGNILVHFMARVHVPYALVANYLFYMATEYFPRPLEALMHGIL